MKYTKYIVIILNFSFWYDPSNILLTVSIWRQNILMLGNNSYRLQVVNMQPVLPANSSLSSHNTAHVCL